ncbi:hypothetical protein T4D_8682 [Trichinella pseudospiralis]|uniref:Uncharacterized protein n=1 Tax=Trichinella pseudospiralis TaxID=6337 RepID=A0A0V1F9T2_TRIPS|nr:hypothetical protein T4D_8682 [Trichinella pseudospiralis]
MTFKVGMWDGFRIVPFLLYFAGENFCCCRSTTTTTTTSSNRGGLSCLVLCLVRYLTIWMHMATNFLYLHPM